jgi:hypothetical protein
MRTRRHLVPAWLVVASCFAAGHARASEQQPQPPTQAAPFPAWQYGAFLDVGALFDSNSPSNHLFRNRGTTPRVDELAVNMTAAYLRKTASESSRIGVEVTLQTGKDSELFGFSSTAPNIGGADVLRHLGPTDVSYLAPIGKGLTIQGGIFSSLIGYDSLYARDNLEYTRPWGADYTPYLMLGVNAAYPVTSSLTVTGVLVNGYWHLAHANDVPSSGGQLSYKPNDHLNVKETLLYGPHQTDTSLKYWRFLSDTIVERRWPRVTAAFEYQASTERVADPAGPRAWWMSAQLPIRWSLHGPLALAVRPEVAWDSDGRWTGFVQRIKAFTSTVEYRIPYRGANAIVRGEYRVDNSTGSGGGFFDDGDIRGVPRLTPTQHLLGISVILTFDGAYQR